MYLTKIDQIFDLVKQRPKQHLVASWAVDEHTVEAVSKAVDMNLVEATLVGDENVITGICRTLSINPRKFVIVNVNDDYTAAFKSVELINDRPGGIIMKGTISTDKFIKAMIDKERGLISPGSVLSHVTVMEIPVYNKLIILGDVAIIPQPDIRQKAAIVNYLIRTAHSLGIDLPKVAIIAATDQVLPAIPACTDAAIICKMAERNQLEKAVVDGPLSLDLCFNKDAAEIKGIKSEVTGDPDCLLFPNIESGNIFYKTNVMYAGVKRAAIIAGAKVPAVLSSRSDNAQTKLNSIALAICLHKEG